MLSNASSVFNYRVMSKYLVMLWNHPIVLWNHDSQYRNLDSQYRNRHIIVCKEPVTVCNDSINQGFQKVTTVSGIHQGHSMKPLAMLLGTDRSTLYRYAKVCMEEGMDSLKGKFAFLFREYCSI